MTSCMCANQCAQCGTCCQNPCPHRGTAKTTLTGTNWSWKTTTNVKSEYERGYDAGFRAGAAMANVVPAQKPPDITRDQLSFPEIDPRS